MRISISRRWTSRMGLLLAVLLVGIGVARSQSEEGGSLVLIAKIDGAIMPPTKDYYARALERAEREGATCLLVEMDTPGGHGEAMRQIAQMNLAAKVPVVVYVTPQGARAASAGAVIGLSAHLLAMAPGTTIGAAHPVLGTGQDIPKDMREKVVNDMSAFVRSVAEKRGKSVEWAEDIIHKSISSTETEALKLKIADFIASNRADLFRQLNGRTVKTEAGTKTLRTLNARTETEEMSWVERFLLFLFDPNIALILGMVAVYGIIAEINNPGAIFPGVVGSICLILSLFSLSVLSVNAAGAALIILAVALFIIDIYATSHGILTAGGVISFIIGALMLFDPRVIGVNVSLPVVISLAAISAGFFGFLMTAALRTHKSPPGGGPETLIGQTGTARTPINPTGKVFADGTFWSAVNVGFEPIQAGDSVVITGRDGLTLKVRRSDSPAN